MSFLKDYPQLDIIKNQAIKKKISVFLVGGFFRNSLLGRSCTDFDFAVQKGALRFAKEFSKKIKGAFVLLDAKHACARVVKKQKGNTYTFDFADFRGDTIEKDLLGRDFTINTLCCKMNALSDRTSIEDALLDMKKGLKDFKAKRIKMVSSKAFMEDPLRLLRAFSLEATIGFQIESKTLARIKKDKDLIKNVSAERIRDELFKILATSRAATTFIAMDKIGLLEKIIPQVTFMYHIKQGTYHHLNVWKHSLETIRQLEKLIEELCEQEDIQGYLAADLSGGRSRKSILKLGALLHDVGKPDTIMKQGKKLSFHGHERLGKAIARSIAKDLKLSVKERFALSDMVLWHLRPGYLSNFKRPSERSIFRYLRDTGEEAVSIALLSWADQRSTRGPLTSQADQKHHEKICKDLIRRYFKKKNEKPFTRLIDGNDLIKELKLQPSPLFSKILNEVEEQQVLGKIETKKDALNLARKVVNKK